MPVGPLSLGKHCFKQSRGPSRPFPKACSFWTPLERALVSAGTGVFLLERGQDSVLVRKVVPFAEDCGVTRAGAGLYLRCVCRRRLLGVDPIPHTLYSYLPTPRGKVTSPPLSLSPRGDRILPPGSETPRRPQQQLPSPP